MLRVENKVEKQASSLEQTFRENTGMIHIDMNNLFITEAVMLDGSCFLI